MTTPERAPAGLPAQPIAEHEPTPSVSNPVLDAALRYHELGIVVHPCVPGSKVPAVAGWSQPRTQTREEVIETFKDWKGNVGGLTQGHVVIDVDVKVGTDGRKRTGDESLPKWTETHGALPPTLTIKTPSGGLQFWYRLPDNFVAGTVIASEKDDAPFGRDVDVLGQNTKGGFANAVLAPSRLPSGEYTVVFDVPVANAPEQVLAAVKGVKGSPSIKQPTAWSWVPEDDPTRPDRIKLQREVMTREAKTPMASGGGAHRYVMMFQKLGPGLLLDPETTMSNFAEIYDPALPEHDRWLPDCEADLVHTIERAYRLQMVDGAAPDQTWQDAISADKMFARLTTANDTSPSPSPSPSLFRWGGWDDEVAPLEWAIDGVITKGSVNLFVGAPNSMKTWTAVSMATAVASGRPWLGKHNVVMGRAALLDYESGDRRCRIRAKLLGTDGVEDRLGYHWSAENLNDEAFWQQLGEQNLTLLVIDSLSRGTPGVEENSREMDRALVLAKKYICEATGGTVVFIHHENKGGGVRGSTAIVAAADTVLGFEANENNKRTQLKRTKVSCIRTKDSSGLQPMDLQLTDECGLELYLPVPTSMVGDGKVFKSDVDMLRAQIRLALPVSGVEELRQKVGRGKKPVDEQVKLMIERGEIRKVGREIILDGMEDRLKRVLAAVASDQAKSAKALAKLARVDVQDIQTFEHQGHIECLNSLGYVAAGSHRAA